ncbi:MAG: ABC transporter ATP-binding protein [Spirochaetia bacterium]|nr:ABC transporter ATP-binding protein [Spirochaetia bacterium]
MLSVEHVTKQYGPNRAVDDLCFSIGTGQIAGLLGANGAGKSTTMNMITGYLPISSGRIHLHEHEIAEHPKEFKRHIGYLPEFPPLYHDMSVTEQLRFACSLRRAGTKSYRDEEIRRVCALTHIEEMKDRLIGHLSKGYKQRVGLAQALIGSPELLILDEPTAGLDPRQIIEMRNLITQLKEQHTILISSHILSEIASICSRLLILDHGRLVADDTPEHLMRAAAAENLLLLRIKGTPDQAKRLLDPIESITGFTNSISAEPGCCDCTIESAANVDLRDRIFYACAAASVPIRLLQPKNPTIEDMFIQMTEHKEPYRL